MSRFIALVAALCLALVACGGGGDSPSPTPPGSSSYRVTIARADRLAVGPERFVVLLEDARGQPVTNASVQLRFFYIDPVRANRKTVKNAVAATPVELDREYALALDDGTQLVMGPGPTGLFANQIAFDQPGDWVVDVSGSAGSNNLGTIEVPFSVGERAVGPRAGQPAPETNGGPPEGPVLVVFGEAGACLTEACGPLNQVVEQVAASTGIQTITPGDSQAVRDAWGVGSEQAVFLVGGDATVLGALHTIATPEEVAALVALAE